MSRCNFNPPSPCGEGRQVVLLSQNLVISIHPPRAGRDVKCGFDV